MTPAGRRLCAALAAVLVRDNAPEVRLVRAWLNSWSGLGLIVAGMAHQGWDVQLTACGDGRWRATFYTTGIAHSIGRLGVGAHALAGGAAGGVEGTGAWNAVTR